MSIDRFNVATDLTEGKKFIRFKRHLALTEQDAFTILVRFFNFVAINYAFQPRIDPDDADILAEFCWFERTAADLIAGLQAAGFVNADLTIHDWFTHQPLAEKIVFEREMYASRSSSADLSHEKCPAKTFSTSKIDTKVTKEDNSNTIPPSPLPQSNGEWALVSESQDPKKRVASAERIRGPCTIGELIPSLAVDTVIQTRKVSEADLLCQDFCTEHGYRDQQTREALRFQIQKFGALHGLEGVRFMIADINDDKNVREPIKVLFAKLRGALQAN
ncbi:MAG TPA: hypothetical protein VGL38_08185 [bacterium]|jgi:hypothetical protein